MSETKIEKSEFRPEALPGVGFFDNATKRKMRYIYPDTQHWTAGWIVVQNRSGDWMTLRKASEADVRAITSAVVAAHHREGDDEGVSDVAK